MRHNKSPKHPLSFNALEGLIDRYFDGATTEEEEQLLRIELAHTTYSSPNIEEAQAVLGMFAIGAKQHNGPVSTSPQHWIAYVASIAIILGIGVTWSAINYHHNNRCYAYVGNVKISDSDQVMELMESDLQSIHSASIDANAQFNDDLSDMAEMMNSLDNNPNDK